MGMTKIDWCDRTLNPVIGCERGCAYCYAKRLNDRFHFVERWDEPEFQKNALKHIGTKDATSFFMDSMSDIEFWDPSVILSTTISMSVKGRSDNAYIFLTKSTLAIERFRDLALSKGSLRNAFFGYSCGTNALMEKALNQKRVELDFLSIEPIEEDLDMSLLDQLIKYAKPNLVIIGAETGNRDGKVIPDKRWIFSVMFKCNRYGIGFFMKESLRPIIGNFFRQDKLPWPCGKQVSE